MNIGIMGLGVVGTCHKNWFIRNGHTVLSYDPPKGLLDNLDDADLVFVCVPTPDGPRHLDAINSCVTHLAGEKTVVIRSTVTPGTTANLQRQYPQHRFLYIPEFLQEDTAQHDFENPPLYVIGTPDTALSWPLRLLPAAPQHVHTNYTTAELYKLARNAFFCVKNAFFNQLWEHCQGIASASNTCQGKSQTYDDLALAASLDPLIGPTHTITPHKGKRGYAGKCLPKDANILLSSDIHLGGVRKLTILRHVQGYNHELLRSQGLLP